MASDDLHLDKRHDFAIVFSGEMSEHTVQYISRDLTELKFNCAVRKHEEDWVLLVGLHDEEKMLRTAESENFICKWTSADPSKREKRNQKVAEQKSYLDPKIIAIEGKKPFKFENRNEYGDQGAYDSILTEADKSRFFYIILDKIRLSQMPQTVETLKEKPASGKETFIYFCKQKGYIKEITPLWSKAWQVRAQTEGKNVNERSQLLQQTREWSRIFIDTERIRQMYGDEIAIYFEWMTQF